MIKNIKYLLVSLVVVSLLGGCKKWIDINYDPTQLSDQNATPDLILPDLLLGAASRSTSQFTMAEWMGYWSWPFDEANAPLVTYNIQEAKYFPGLGATINVSLLEQNARRNNQPFYWGIAKFLKALEFSGAVDTYNNIPYRETFDVNIRSPHYDSGVFIYEDLMVQLDSALLLIRNADQDKALHISNADIMCHGNKDKWYRVINTLKLRLLVHQANRTERQSYIRKEMDKIIQEGSGFLRSGEDASVNPGFTQEKPSFYFSSFSAFDLYTRRFLGAGSFGQVGMWTAASANVTAMNFLKNNRDPRLAFFYNPVTTPLPPGAPEPFSQPAPAQFRGNRFGLTIDPLLYPYQGTANVSQIGGVKERGVAVSPTSTGLTKGYDMPCWVISSVECLFLQAEAVQRGYLPGNAEVAYTDAVKESFRWLNVGGNSTNIQLSDDAFNTWYVAETAGGNVNVSWAAASDKYKLLMFQKYLALNGIDAYETYVDYRRNGRYPDIPLSYSDAKIKNQMPIRSPYPEIEYAQNKENVGAQGPIDIFTSKIWWMP